MRLPSREHEAADLLAWGLEGRPEAYGELICQPAVSGDDLHLNVAIVFACLKQVLLPPGGHG